MKKKGFGKILVAGLSGALILGMSACGSAAKSEIMQSVNGNGAYSTGSSWGSDLAMPDYGQSEEMLRDEVINQTTSKENAVQSSRKVIKTAKLSVQTRDYDAFSAALEKKVAEVNAYFQYADVSNTDYRGDRKQGTYTIRVPEANLNQFLAGVEDIATVTNKTVGEQDVTLSYVDTESRIKSLKIEQDSLLELLKQAQDLDYIIRLQSRLTEVRYEIENYESQLRTFDDKIAYSTVNISAFEVQRVSEPVPKTVGERISSGWKNTMINISEGTQNFVVWFVVNLPYLVFWGIVITIAVIVVKKKIKKTKRKHNENSTAEQNEE